jgi:hypothetical protein
MVSAQQYSISWEPQALRRRVDEICELRWRLSRVTAHLIDLTGGGLHVEDRIVFYGLVDGRIDDPGMRGADRIDPAFSRRPITDHDSFQSGAGVVLTLLVCWF